ncbi:MAG: hypothetical protein WBB45_02155 [Cyclobacteriaceae bacterium]
MKRSLTTVLLLFFMAGAYAQTATNLTVRAKAKDAKFIGTSIGGAFVMVEDAMTGELLASGYTTGSTGNTARIMQEPVERGATLSDENTAAFETTLRLEAPKKVTIAVRAPATHAQAAIEAQTQVWLIPGKHIEGDGIVIEIPGFIVDVLTPQTHERANAADADITIRANVVMMCGCPVTEGGMWDASGYEVHALVTSDGKVVADIPMSITSKANTFEATFAPGQGGVYQVTVYAYDPATGNTGADIENFLVSK